MNEPCDDRSDGQLRVLREFVEEGASIDGDVLEIANDAWVVHGVVGYDGEVPIALFGTYDEAKHVLDQVPRTTGLCWDAIELRDRRRESRQAPHEAPCGS